MKGKISAILALCAALAGCNNDTSNTIAHVRVKGGTAACPQMVILTTIRHEEYYFERSWGQDCAPTAYNLENLPVITYAGRKGRKRYWVTKTKLGQEDIQIYWYGYAQ